MSQLIHFRCRCFKYDQRIETYLICLVNFSTHKSQNLVCKVYLEYFGLEIVSFSLNVNYFVYVYIFKTSFTYIYLNFLPSNCLVSRALNLLPKWAHELRALLCSLFISCSEILFLFFHICCNFNSKHYAYCQVKVPNPSPKTKSKV